MVCVSLNITYLVCITLLIYIFSGLAICFGYLIGELFPRKDYFSQSQHPLVACSSLRRVEAFGLLLFHFGMSVAVVLVQLIFGQRCWRDFMDVTPIPDCERQSHRELPNLLALTVFPTPLPQRSLSLGCWNASFMYSLWLGSIALQFDWLWFSVVVSVCCKEKFPC